MRLDDTIAAISTPLGRGGIGVVRLSGSGSRAIAASFLGFRKSHEWRSWSAALADLLDPGGEVIDHVVATFYAAPRSYTAEDVVEIACHGSPVVLRHCLERAVHAGARLAEPGEFTLRAYLHGRLDLPQAEAVRDLIEATTLYQARIAAQQVDGAVSRRVAPLKAQLVDLIALLEAGIDFAEDDISVAPDEEILRRLEPIAAGAGALAGSFAYGKLVHSGLTLAIAGRPNVGKSSLFNRLLDQNRAIVSDVPGTTRDTVSETAAVAGIPVRYVDTAGIRQGQDRIEEMGIERSLEAIAGADLTLVVMDGSRPIEAEDEAVLERARAAGRTLVVINKSDVPTAALQSRDREGAVRPATTLRVSALTGEGIEQLRSRILDELAPAGGQEAGFITSLRHEAALRECTAALAKAERAVRERIPHEMLLLDLYEALHALDALTGATTADDILHRIFATFCIGK